ncbi:hypothetical protein [Brachybacterium sp.]|uniref:hypothetical protein n=1 Tax=Brachybacterium sp. TaxID=1891286 RepID=UPI002ED26ACC
MADHEPAAPCTDMHQTPPADPRSGTAATAATAHPPPRRPRTTFYLTVGCLSVIAGLVLGVGGFFGVRAIQGDGGEPVVEEEPAVLEETPVGPDAAVPFGTTFPIHSQALDGDVEATFVDLDWDADAEIAEANSLNEPPQPGNRYILLTFEGVYHGDGTPDPVLGAWMDATYVAEDGTEIARVHVVTPHYGEMVERVGAADGETIRAEIPFEIPEDIEGGGHVVLNRGLQDVDEGAWVEAS